MAIDPIGSSAPAQTTDPSFDQALDNASADTPADEISEANLTAMIETGAVTVGQMILMPMLGDILKEATSDE